MTAATANAVAVTAANVVVTLSQLAALHPLHVAKAAVARAVDVTQVVTVVAIRDVLVAAKAPSSMKHPYMRYRLTLRRQHPQLLQLPQLMHLPLTRPQQTPLQLPLPRTQL